MDNRYYSAEPIGNVRDSDTSLWLHNKLGSNEPWTSGSITSQLNPDVLRNIKVCFPELQTQVKLKLLLSFFHIPRRNLDEWKLFIDEIIDVALSDSESWVSMLAEIMKPYASSSSLNFEITGSSENRRILMDLLDDVSKEWKRAKDINILPMECHCLNKNALSTIVGPQKLPQKHFTLKRKPKSIALRAEFLQKCSDAIKTNAKPQAPTIPLRTRGMPRKLTDATPLKGIPSQNPPPKTPNHGASAPSRTLSRTSAGKKEGGVKLLDITEQPPAFLSNKKRKKAQDLEEERKKAADESSVNETPDYAATLPANSAPSPPPSTPLIPPQTPMGYQPPPTPQAAISATAPVPFNRVSSIPEGPPPTPNPQIPSTSPETSSGSLSSNYLPAKLSPSRKTVTAQTPHNMTKTVILQVPTHQPQQIVTLSKELMEKAQEIFRTANKATRPEKEHILKFMAGTRINPCPELGSIVTIKLSEHDEQVTQSDGSVVACSVETHFQMNYNTGEWKVIQKPPKFDQNFSQNHHTLAA